ncbi:CB1 cannabinoid receptor-interacting protein 1-like [Mytilus galloprovincialis]|uniref:CB1 cannabinoid receptor-interacting protein 1-like n=1 Tax=Mytilus galloprovincialis TaxID=29158 RepID=UPI003F7C0357
MAIFFKVWLSIRRKEDEKPIYQKQDGQRFVQPHTTKLNVNTTYAIKVVIRPPVKLMELVIQGESIELEELTTEDEDCITYSSHFNTSGYDLCRRQKRKDVPLVFLFEGGHTLIVTLQCKFYSENEVEHCHWGQTLTWLEYECKVEDGSSHVDVLREKYL